MDDLQHARNLRALASNADRDQRRAYRNEAFSIYLKHVGLLNPRFLTSELRMRGEDFAEPNERQALMGLWQELIEACVAISDISPCHAITVLREMVDHGVVVDPREGEAALRRAFAIAEARFELDPTLLSDACLSLTHFFGQRATDPGVASGECRAHWNEALAWMERHVALYERLDGPWHTGFAVSLANLADLYRRCGRMPECVAAMRRALAIAERTYGPESSVTANMRRDLERFERPS